MTVNTQGRIDRLTRRLESAGKTTPNSTVYAEGVKTKLSQARFGLDMLRDLEEQEDRATAQDMTTSASPKLLGIAEQVSFYCDCFWDFLRSALDILAQLINELRSLGLGERDVDIKKVTDRMTAIYPGDPLEKTLRNLLKSRAFKQLEDYRHCSTHRRPIYIETSTVIITTTGTPGYYSGSSSSQQSTLIGRYLCTNPWALNPTVGSFGRPVVEFCESLLTKIESHINILINRLS